MESQTDPQNEIPKNGRGRPKKHFDSAARKKAWKEKHREYRRLDCHITPTASWRLRKLSKHWGLSISSTVEKLLLEACEKHEDILFEDQYTFPE